MIRGTGIKPHYPVSIRINRRPHLTKVLEPIKAKPWPEAEPAFPRPSWDQAKDKLHTLGWKVPRFSTMNPMQEYYLEQLEVKPGAIEFGDKYCIWSATLTVQDITQHYQEDKMIKEHIGLGQPLVFTYMSRLKRKPKDNNRSKNSASSLMCTS